jgi:nucleotide-binding universal stress UspA family protein
VVLVYTYFEDRGLLSIMASHSDTERRGMLDHVLVPVAHEEDALATANALEPYQPERVTVLHVVEKGEGVPDKTPVEQSEELAEESYAAFRTVFPDADDHTAYGRDIPQKIFEAAEEVGASAVAYRSRGGNRLLEFLSGDISLKLVTNANRPVIALPHVDADD